MIDRTAVRAVAIATTVAMASSGAVAFDETRYPDWSGQWVRPPGVGFQWDISKAAGLAQQAPLTGEYKAVIEASLADQSSAAQLGYTLVTCRTNDMPWVFRLTWPIGFFFRPNIASSYLPPSLPP